MGYHRERTQIKVSQRKRLIEQSLRGFQIQGFCCPRDQLPSQYQGVTICKDSHLSCESRVFIGVALQRHARLTDCASGWTQSLSQLIPQDPKIPRWLNFLAWSFSTLRLSGVANSHPKQRHSLSEAERKGQTSPWARPNSLLPILWVVLANDTEAEVCRLKSHCWVFYVSFSCTLCFR